MHVSLIFPRFKYNSGDPPLGIASIAAYLREEKVPVSIIDTTFNSSLKYVEEQLEKQKPGLVGIYFDTIMYYDGLKIARFARKKGLKVIAGGPHATVMPETLLDEVDAVAIGEGELTLAEAAKKGTFENVKGLWYKKNGKLIKNKPREPICNLDELPAPALDLLDMENYFGSWHYLDSVRPGLRGTNVIATRGCPFQCTYCQPTLTTIFGKKLRTRSPESIVKEIKHLKGQYGIEGIFFHDDTLTANRKWVMDFCRLLKKERLKIYWACNTRVDTLDEELIKEMKASGLRGLHIGVESGSERIVNTIYKKNIKLEQVPRLIKMAKKHGVHTLCFFMIGAPTETKKEINQTIRFARKLPCDEATFSITSPLPHTALYDSLKKDGYKLSDNFEDFNYYSKRAFMDKDISYRLLQYYQKKALLTFYLHPYRWGYVMKHLASVHGWKNMMTKIRRFF